MNPTTLRALVRTSALGIVLGVGALGHAATVELEATGQLRVMLGDDLDPMARVYRSLDMPPSLLVMNSAFGRPVYITTGPTMARLVEESRVRPDGKNPMLVRLDTSGPRDKYLTVKTEGATLILERDGRTVTLEPAPPVLGARTLDELVTELPDYQRSAADYAPDPGAVATLRALDQPTEVLVFFGSWCSHCEQVVPHLVRVLQDVGDSKLRVTFHGVPPPGGGEDRLADSLGIRGLPTAIIRRDGKEIGRVTGDDWVRPETALVKVVSAGS